MQIKKLSLSVLGASAILLSSVSFAQAANQDTAIDRNTSVVVDSNGNCVLTKWDDEHHLCDPAAKPAPAAPAAPAPVAVAPSPARQLTRDQRVVYFAYDKSDVDAASAATLDNLASALRSSNDVKRAHIVGYADPDGNAKYNEKLSAKRAHAVQDYMAGKGYLNTDVATTRGLGETDQFADCKDVQKNSKKRISCQQPDRRVEVEIEFLK